MVLSIDKAAKSLIKQGKVDDGLLNMIEMAFRAYDPCHACASHAIPGQMPIVVEVLDHKGELVRRLARGF
jgi:F420-non-reducing hydrogenase large subunit